MRRRLADCAVLANRIEILLDDLLWILTDRQIQEQFQNWFCAYEIFLLIILKHYKAAVLCVKSLSDSIEASRRQTMALQRSNSEMSIMSEIPSTGQTNLQTDFLVESSNHFSINRLDLHICEGKSAI